MKIRPRDVLDLLKRAGSEFFRDDCPRLAAALSYYTVFALAPLIALLLLIAGIVWNPQEIQNAIGYQIRDLMGEQASREVLTMVAHKDPTGGQGPMATIVGLAMLAFGATGAFLQLQGALNKAWEVKPDPKKGGVRQFIAKRVLSAGMVLAVAFLLMVSLAVSAVLSALGSKLAFIPEPALHAVDVTLSLAVLTLLFATIFRFLPDAEIEWRDVWVGALFTSMLFVIGKFVIGLYLGRSAPGDAFGAAGALAVILVWIYYAGMIVLFGAEFTQAWAERRGARKEPESGAVHVEQKEVVTNTR